MINRKIYCECTHPDGMSTTSIAIPEESASEVSVQEKQERMEISDLFLPWKYSWTVRLKQSVAGWSWKGGLVYFLKKLRFVSPSRLSRMRDISFEIASEKSIKIFGQTRR